MIEFRRDSATRAASAHGGGRAGRRSGSAGGRLAAIDIGSNSIHMVVVERGGAGGYQVLARERDMVRLGKSALADPERRALAARRCARGSRRCSR